MTLDQLRRFDAFVFDMDGVLLDSEPLHLAALNRVIGDEGHTLTEEQNLELVGSSLADTLAALHRRFGLLHPPEHYVPRFDEAVVAVLTETSLEPLPGVRALLDALHQIQQRIGLATQSRQSWVEATLAGLALTGRFEAIVTGEQVTRGKPDPELYLRACALLDAEPRRSLAIEDSLTGARAARAAGMTVVGVRNVYAGPRLAQEADLVVGRLDELLNGALAFGPAGQGGSLGEQVGPGRGREATHR